VGLMGAWAGFLDGVDFVHDSDLLSVHSDAYGASRPQCT